MKIKIRSGVFETNSSSTHSFTILKSEDVGNRQQQYKKISERLEYLDSKINELTFEERLELDDLEDIGTKKFAISFQIKSPISKLVWLKGLIDNICEKTKSFGRDKEEVIDFYKLLKQEYCELENITEAEADNRILEEGNKNLEYEKVLNNIENQDEKINELLKNNVAFKNFAEKYDDKVLALQHFAREQMKNACEKCKGRLQCDHYFSEGALDDCYCGFESFYSIASQINKIREERDYKQFVKEFISDKYVVIGIENWNHFYTINTDTVY